MILYALQVASRNIRRTGVYELAVNLIGEQVKVIFLNQVTQLQHLLAGVKITRGVVGVANEYTLGTLCDELLEFLNWG